MGMGTAVTPRDATGYTGNQTVIRWCKSLPIRVAICGGMIQGTAVTPRVTLAMNRWPGGTSLRNHAGARQYAYMEMGTAVTPQATLAMNQWSGGTSPSPCFTHYSNVHKMSGSTKSWFAKL